MELNRSPAEDALRDYISAQGFRPGDRLPPERQLTEALGVSRPTVREAISRLASAGALEARRGSGTYVAPIDLRHVFDVRLQLEPFAAGQAALHRTREQLAGIEAALAEMRDTESDPTAFAAADAQLHELIAIAAANPVLRDSLARLAGLARLSRDVTADAPEVRVTALENVTRLVAAIRGGDAPGATAAMRRHLELVRTAVA
jgi:GntR family transcriptional repressor for pyruvate dehydrogenase complex